MSQVVAAELFAYSLPLEAFAGGQRRGWLVRLHDGDGRTGWGDAACWPGFGAGTEPTQRALQRLVASHSLLGRGLDSLADVEGWGLPRSAFPELSHAVELAALDLLARRRGLPLCALLGERPATHVTVHTLVHDAAGAQVAAQQGVEYLKLKVGRAPLAEDVRRLESVREAAPGCALRLDANGAWSSVAEAEHALRALAAGGLDWIEQPLPPGDLQGLAQLRGRSGLRVAVDEGLRGNTLAEVAVAADAVVIKPMFVGGLLSAARLARAARAHGLEVCLTHALESAVGRTGALHLAAALEGLSACGLTNPLAEDLAVTPSPSGGRLLVPTQAGLGLPALDSSSQIARVNPTASLGPWGREAPPRTPTVARRARGHERRA